MREKNSEGLLDDERMKTDILTIETRDDGRRGPCLTHRCINQTDLFIHTEFSLIISN